MAEIRCSPCFFCLDGEHALTNFTTLDESSEVVIIGVSSQSPDDVPFPILVSKIIERGSSVLIKLHEEVIYLLKVFLLAFYSITS